MLPFYALLALFSSLAPAEGHGRISIGLNLGGPVCRPPCRSWCGCPPSFIYYRPAPVYYVQPAPRVIVQPAPVVLQPDPIIVPSQYRGSENAAPIQPAVALREPTSFDQGGDVSRNLELLKNPDINIRREAVMDLGRSKMDRAVAPLTATLAGDSSPEVRDAAARALGLIAAPTALPALRYAAQADSDRDVRRSCQFSVEIIQSNLRNR